MKSIQKKIFFMHVAKTAGSSFNKFLKQNFNGEEHCEKFLDSNRLELTGLSYLRSLDFISGHLKWICFEINSFPRHEYFALTFLREPMHQLISHINWVVHIYDIGESFFNGHPKAIQELSLELRSVDLYNPENLFPILEKHHGLFKNNQSKYFSDQEGKLHLREIEKKLSELDMIGVTEFYEKSLRLFILLNGLDMQPVINTENKNPYYKLGLDVLNNPVVFEFLSNYNSLDTEIYQHFSHKTLSLFEKYGI